MDSHRLQFSVVYQPAHLGQTQLLGSSPDANAATVAADHALWRLRKQGRSGEVLVVRDDPDATVVLRLPIVARPTRITAGVRVAPAVARRAKAHPGWAAVQP